MEIQREIPHMEVKTLHICGRLKSNNGSPATDRSISVGKNFAVTHKSKRYRCRFVTSIQVFFIQKMTVEGPTVTLFILGSTVKN